MKTNKSTKWGISNKVKFVKQDLIKKKKKLEEGYLKTPPKKQTNLKVYLKGTKYTIKHKTTNAAGSCCLRLNCLKDFVKMGLWPNTALILYFCRYIFLFAVFRNQEKEKRNVFLNRWKAFFWKTKQ